MIDQTTDSRQKSTITHQTASQSNSVPLRLITFLALAFILMACGSTQSLPTTVTVQLALPTPTLEPTFTPSPVLNNNSTPSPTAIIQTESAPTSAPEQASLSGRILDQNSHQPIAGAEVSTGTTNTTTDANGRYTLVGLAPGQYVLSVIHPDYDPGLSSIFTVAAGEEPIVDVPLYEPDTSPYPQDPMLTNPLDPKGAPTPEDAERLARVQGLTGEVTDVRETKLSGEYLVNYKIGDEVRAAVAEIDHEVWELTDEAGRKWWIIKVCGNLASPLPGEKPIPTPKPTSLPLMAEVVVDELSVRACTSEECAKVGTVPRGGRVEVFGCLADKSWCEVSLSGGRGWCTGQSLQQLAVATAIPSATPVLPTPTPTPTQEVVTSGEGEIISGCEEFEPGTYTQSMENLIEVIVAGKPDFRNGAMVPFPVCGSPQPKKLKITIETAISEADTPLVEPPRFYLFRSLNWSVPDHIHAHNPVFLNVEHDYATNDSWGLETEVSPGLYLLVFEHDSYADLINPRQPNDIPQSVTYRVEIVNIP